MKDFLQQNQKKIKGTLSCFDCLIFRGYLPVQNGWQMAGFLNAQKAGNHLKLQTWFPMTMQVYVNGQEWLARKLEANGIAFTKLGNVFLDVEDMPRAQALADRLPSLKWPRILDRWTRRINPLMEGILKGMGYYWVTAQSEYATDVIFSSRRALKELYPRWVSHSMLCS